jgi:hypothetical protein
MSKKNSLYICKTDDTKCTLLTCDTSKSECVKKLCDKKTGICSTEQEKDCEYNKECKLGLDKYAWHDERHNKQRIKCDPTNISCKINNNNWHVDSYKKCNYADNCAKSNEVIREYLTDDNCKIYKCVMKREEENLEATCEYKNCNRDCDHCSEFIKCDNISDGCGESGEMTPLEKNTERYNLNKDIREREKSTRTFIYIGVTLFIIIIIIIISVIIFFFKKRSSQGNPMYRYQ